PPLLDVHEQADASLVVAHLVDASDLRLVEALLVVPAHDALHVDGEQIRVVVARRLLEEPAGRNRGDLVAQFARFDAVVAGEIDRREHRATLERRRGSRASAERQQQEGRGPAQGEQIPATTALAVKGAASGAVTKQQMQVLLLAGACAAVPGEPLPPSAALAAVHD